MPHLQWSQRQDIGPAARSGAALAYDAVRKLTHVFGGQTPPTEAWADTWAWSGRYWTQVARIGPGGRLNHSMTFDVQRGRGVLFGGSSAAGDALGDTWSFDGVDWTQVEDLGPAPRYLHAAAYNPTRGRIVLFGGLRAGPDGPVMQNDTWEWDGGAWTQVEEAGPAARVAHVMAFDPTTNQVMLFGGRVNAGQAGAAGLAPNDTWEWNGTAWTQVADTGPEPREVAAMASTGAATVLHGGVGSDVFGDTWQWASGAWTKLQDFGPARRYGHTMAFDSDRGKVILFGGLTATAATVTALGDTWEAPAPGGAPPPGSVVANVAVQPDRVDLSNPGGDTVSVEFDLPQGSGTQPLPVLILMGVENQPAAPVMQSTVPPGQHHAVVTVRQLDLKSAAIGRLHLQAPVTVALYTDRGDAFAQLVIDRL